MSNRLKLYWSLGSQPSRAVKTLLDIGKIDTEYIWINVLKKQQFSQQYSALNPFSKIPCLQDGSFLLGESSAIMTYICDKYGHLSLYHGKTPQKRAIVNQYLSWYQSYFRPAMFTPFKRHLDAAYFKVCLSYKDVTEMMETMWAAIEKFDQILGLNEQNYLAGDRVTIADFLYFYQLTNLRFFAQDYSRFKNIENWAQRISSIEEVRAIMEKWEIIAVDGQKRFQAINYSN